MTYRHEKTGLGVATITPIMEAKISAGAHLLHKCAGYETISDDSLKRSDGVVKDLDTLAAIIASDAFYLQSPMKKVVVTPKAEIQTAIDEVSAQNLKEWVTWLSSFESRYNRAKDPNVHVVQMQQRIEGLLQGTKWTYKIDLIDHTSTKQKSIRLRLEGTDLKDEVIVMGGHLDSISGMFGSGKAPGADDNASGSSNLIEALRIISQRAPTRRSIEFFWYAGEESGLLGSAEIAKKYKADARNVRAVLQLDMTLHPGSGHLVIGNVQDYTTAWLKDYLVDINSTYLKVTLIPDECGYACSDHASWYKNGYPTLMPFEANTETMNSNIHTPKDVINQMSDFEHSAVFSKIAVIFALDLGNTEIH